VPRHGSVPASLGREERLESGRICRHILYSAYLRLKASLLERFIGTCLEQTREFRMWRVGKARTKEE
jgi:hypothetical protein